MTSQRICEQYIHKYSTYRVAQHDHISSRKHAWLKSWRLRIAHLCVITQLSSTCHVSFSLPHLTLSTSTSSLSPTSPIFPTVSPTRTRLLVHDEYLPCDVPRQSVGSTQIPSLTGYEPKLIETEAVKPEDLKPRKIDLDRNLGTDPYQIPERLMRSNFQNLITEDMDEFGKVGAEMSYVQSQMHSDFDSAESIADSDLEDGELRKMLASPLYVRSREDCESSRIPTASVKLAAMIQGRGASASVFKLI